MMMNEKIIRTFVHVLSECIHMNNQLMLTIIYNSVQLHTCHIHYFYGCLEAALQPTIVVITGYVTGSNSRLYLPLLRDWLLGSLLVNPENESAATKI